ncbi:hypothetical protein OsI_18624 [Oryza sativa Indica Group]|uniref:UspA domain-containing protein n=1 Tax=Oryza sativa subsp. indica TaxID=39946 RepID=A2Y0U2_ORYSI|nr:hypothetical protein OsI_18624 [Oryza sativa Indica Group]
MAAVSVGGGGRNIGVAMDFSACSKAALRWAAASLARPGDRLVLVHVKPSFQYEQGVAHLWEQQGSRKLTATTVLYYLRPKYG